MEAAAFYRRSYIMGSEQEEGTYTCPTCGNSEFVMGASHCHICGTKLPAGVYVEFRTVLQMNAENHHEARMTGCPEHMAATDVSELVGHRFNKLMDDLTSILYQGRGMLTSFIDELAWIRSDPTHSTDRPICLEVRTNAWRKAIHETATHVGACFKGFQHLREAAEREAARSDAERK